MMILYSTHCPKCIVVETKLKQAGVEFTVVDDVDKVVEVGNANDITSAPILEADDGKFYDFAEAIKFLKEIQ